MPDYTLKVNGRTHRVSAPSEMPLLWVLRDLVGLTGTKYGCGVGQCRACLVHLDGRPTPACLVPVSGAADAEVTTIEGLSGPLADKVREAWVAEDVPQCGYCQPGWVMATEALLRESPRPSPEQVVAALDGHLCRCGTYPRIARAVRRAAGLPIAVPGTDAASGAGGAPASGTVSGTEPAGG
ncbi:MAG TPA: (2Fe-2S)-binding protein [Polyangiaceae bacterium LLY-WYZ-14_1]|nr:(2Fe-2S)-binding protein [Polyangiaceae bacterium LLY-WYZ-14_1]